MIYRGHREIDNKPVVLKLLKKEYPTPEELAQFRREYEMTRNLDVDGRKFAIRTCWKAL